jgi:heme oxygenase
MASSVSTLRSILRDCTAAAHQRTDEAMSAADLTTRAGLSGFLSVHHAALAVIEPFLANTAYQAPKRVELLEADLAVLGAPPPEAADDLPTSLPPLGVAYVVAGSALGTEVLRRRWSEATDPLVLSAGQFFGDTAMTTYWRRVLDVLKREAPSGAEARELIQAANCTFDIYRHAASRLL